MIGNRTEVNMDIGISQCQRIDFFNRNVGGSVELEIVAIGIVSSFRDGNL